MMDGLSGAGGVIAVVSIAIQLADSVKKLHDFWKSIEAAPSDVQSIIADLEFLCDVLRAIAVDTQPGASDEILEKALRACNANIQQLNAILNQLQPGFASSRGVIRKWTAFKSVLKWDKIKQFQTTLDRLKNTLILVLQGRSIRLESQKHQEFRRVIDSLHCLRDFVDLHNNPFGTISVAGSASQTLMQTPNGSHPEDNQLGLTSGRLYHKTDGSLPIADQRRVSSDRAWLKSLCYSENTLKQTIFASVRIRFAKKDLRIAMPNEHADWLGDTHTEEQCSIIVRPAEWLRMLGITWGFSMDFINSSITQSSIVGWKHTTSPFRAVSDDAPIFQLCKEGDIIAVRDLLSSGKASVKDTASNGATPLHFAAEHFHPDLCRLLITHGADKMATADYVWFLPIRTPFYTAIRSTSRVGAPIEKIQDTARQFLDGCDFSDVSCDSWDIVWSLAANFRILDHEHDLNFRMFEWFVLQFSQDIQTYMMISEYREILEYVTGGGFPKGVSFWLKFILDDAIDTEFDDGSCVLLELVGAMDLSAQAHTLLIEILNRGANPNCVGPVPCESSKLESPTSLSLYDPTTFIAWLSALSKAEIDCSQVFDKELRDGPLVEAGWTREVFQTFLDWDYSAPNFQNDPHCTVCCWRIYDLKIRPLWVYALEEIKNGRNPKETVWALKTDSDAQEDSGSDKDCLSQRSWEPDETAYRSSEKQDSDEESETSERDPPGWNTLILESLRRTHCHGPRLNPVYLHCSVRCDSDGNEEDFLRPWQFYPAEVVCMMCWEHTLGICNAQPESGSDTETDTSSDDGFSPFMIHS